MNSKYLASAGGRFAHLAVSIALANGAYAAFSATNAAGARGMAAGIVATIVSLVCAVILSTKDFQGHALAITVLGPLAGFAYLFLLQLAVGLGPAVGGVLAVVAAFVFLAGIVLGLRVAPASASSDAAGARHGASNEVPVHG